MNSLWRVLAFMFLFVFSAPSAHALTSEWQQAEQGAVRLIASDQAEPGKLYAGLHFKLNGDWHAYWRSPGDAGVPPQADWKDSENFKSAAMLYPLPTRSLMQGLQTYGYHGEIVFPLLIEKTDPTQGVKLKAQLNVLLCNEICVPAKYEVALDMPQGFTATQEATDLLKTWLAKVPKADTGAGLSIQSAGFVSEGGKNLIHLGYSASQPITDAEVIIEPGDGYVLPLTTTVVKSPFIEAELASEIQPKDIVGKELTFTLVDKATGQAVEKKLALSGTAPVAGAPVLAGGDAPAMPTPNMGLMILFALIGGLILNLMPCVLPVLALKALSFASHGGGTPSGVRLSFLSTSAGILFSFIVMAGALIGLKEAGMSVGWGIQFQNPSFLLFLIAVLLLFAANLWGFFEITLPRALADRLSWTQGHGNLLKDFLSGAFATLLATPCSAPFLGAALTFALAGGRTEIIAIFLAMGVGLALPFLIIAIFPSAATLLPRPGNWMIWMKRILAVMLLLTAMWIGWVLSMSFMMKATIEANWAPFNETEIASHVNAGKTVFVDVTAAWCLTCQANKKFVLDREDVKQELSKPDILLMMADWTRPSEVIADYLKRHGRYGIPFNIIYGPKAPQGVVLPELLSKDAVVEGLNKAR